MFFWPFETTHVSQMDDIARKITFLMQIVLIILLRLLVSFLTDTFCIVFILKRVQTFDDDGDRHSCYMIIEQSSITLP